MDIYRKDHTYLVLEKKTKEFMRWAHDEKLFFSGSEDDALLGLPKNKFEAVRVCDCPKNIQTEYEERIDECIKNGEIDL